MGVRTTLSELSPPPVLGTSWLAEYADRIKTLFDASALPLTSVGGTGDAVTATLDPELDSGGLVEGMRFGITWGADNTGAATLAINGAAAVDLLDANGSALTTGALAAGRRDMIEYVGGDFRVLGAVASAGASAPMVTVYTASGTWTKPSGYEDDHPVLVRVWGGGGGGGRSSTAGRAGGGGGGGYAERLVRMADLPSSVTVTIGAGGAGRASSTGNGTAGGNSSFGSVLVGYGGAGGQGGTSGTQYGGGGGGELAAGGSPTGGACGGGDGSTYGGGVASAARTLWGGGGGGLDDAGGPAVMGGGGGGGGATTVRAGGSSLRGGAGGAGGDGSPAAVAGTAPSGGGGGGFDTDGAAGARGQIEVWVL